jgi:hypothetical protein
MDVRAVAAAAGVLLLAGCSSVAPATMVVDGRIDLGPLCPVERVGSPCAAPPGAFEGVEAVATSGQDEVRSAVAGDGSFVLTLTAGSWDVTATAGMSCATVSVSSPGTAVITCDTGIR